MLFFTLYTHTSKQDHLSLSVLNSKNNSRACHNDWMKDQPPQKKKHVVDKESKTIQLKDHFECYMLYVVEIREQHNFMSHFKTELHFLMRRRCFFIGDSLLSVFFFAFCFCLLSFVLYFAEERNEQFNCLIISVMLKRRCHSMLQLSFRCSEINPTEPNTRHTTSHRLYAKTYRIA